MGKGVSGARRKLFENESWLIEHSPDDNSLVVTSIDYHAGPLVIGESRWRGFGEALGIAAPAGAAPTRRAAAVPPDLQPLTRSGDWTVAVSRREKRAYFEREDLPGSPFSISRKELYRIGRSLGKKGRPARLASTGTG